jgi:hypothetical protein
MRKVDVLLSFSKGSFESTVKNERTAVVFFVFQERLFHYFSITTKKSTSVMCYRDRFLCSSLCRVSCRLH